MSAQNNISCLKNVFKSCVTFSKLVNSCVPEGQQFNIYHEYVGVNVDCSTSRALADGGFGGELQPWSDTLLRQQE